jgi:N-acyl-L-homoserine lactone synthetase
MSAQSKLVVIPAEELIALIEGAIERFLNQKKVPYSSLTDPKKVYSRKQVAELLNRSENTITKYIRQRKLHATRLNGIYYISENSFLNFLNNTNNGKS